MRGLYCQILICNQPLRGGRLHITNGSSQSFYKRIFRIELARERLSELKVLQVYKNIELANYQFDKENLKMFEIGKKMRI